MSTNAPPHPHDESTLYRLAGRAVQKEGVPARWREDAVAEYVMAAWTAGLEEDHSRNIQAYQCLRGNGAVVDFMRREERQEALSPGSCIIDAKRVSLDKVIVLRDGERVPMVETIADKNAEKPYARMLEAERREAVERAVGEPPEEEQAVIRMVWLEEWTQEETADALNMTRKAVRGAIGRSRDYLRKRLAEYGDEFSGRSRAKRNKRKKSDLKGPLARRRATTRKEGEIFVDREGPPQPTTGPPDSAPISPSFTKPLRIRTHSSTFSRRATPPAIVSASATPA